MSGNYRFPDIQPPRQAPKRARCTEEIARLYRRKEGTPGGSENATIRPEEHDRRAKVAELVEQLFGRPTADFPDALACEPYLRDALARWLLACCRTPESWYRYARRMARWVADSGRRSLSAQADTSARAIADWLYHLEGRELAARTIVNHREIVRSWFHWLFDRDLVRRTPITRDVRRLHRVDRGAVVKANGRRQVLTADEAAQVAAWALSAASAEAGLSVLLQLTAGLRSQEVAQLERRHLVDRDGVVSLTVPGKGKRTRSVRLEATAVQAWQRYQRLRRRQGDRGPLLVAPGGGHYSARQIQRFAKDAAEIIGRTIEISSHDLRKTTATQLLGRGARVDQVQELLGHASSETTLDCYVVDRQPLTVTTGIVAPATPPPPPESPA